MPLQRIQSIHNSKKFGSSVDSASCLLTLVVHGAAGEPVFYALPRFPCDRAETVLLWKEEEAGVGVGPLRAALPRTGGWGWGAGVARGLGAEQQG